MQKSAMQFTNDYQSLRAGLRLMSPGHLRGRTLLHFINKALLCGVERNSVELESLGIKEYR